MQSGADQLISFTSCKGKISSYVPQIYVDGFQHPLVAAPLDDIDTALHFDWNAEERGEEGYEKWCLCSEDDLGDVGDNELRKSLFAEVKYYEPGKFGRDERHVAMT